MRLLSRARATVETPAWLVNYPIEPGWVKRNTGILHYVQDDGFNGAVSIGVQHDDFNWVRGINRRQKKTGRVLLLDDGVELCDVAELCVTLLEHHVERKRTEFVEVVPKFFADHGHGGVGVVLCASAWFEEDVIDATEELDVASGVTEGGGGLLFFAGVLPHDGGTALGRDNGVDGVFEHEDAVGYCQRQRSARPAFACDSGDRGYAQTGHFDEVAGDGFALAALFGSNAGVGSGEIDEGEDRVAEFLCNLHAAESLAIAFGVGRAEFACDSFLEGTAFEVADRHDGFAVEEGHAAGHSGVIAKGSVAVNLAEIGEDCLDEVHRVWALRVPCQLRLDPGLGRGGRCRMRMR